MKTARRIRGFALIELPLVLFILALIGLAAVAAYRLLGGPVSWYWWPIGFIALPVAGFVAGCMVGWGEEFGQRRKRDSSGQSGN